MLLDISTLTWNRNFIPNIERPARVTACQTPEGMGKRSPFASGECGDTAELRAKPGSRALTIGSETMVYAVGFENVTRCAIAAECWSRRWP